MRSAILRTIAILTTVVCTCGVAAQAAPALRPAPFTDVRITDEFWAPRLETVRTRTIPHCFEQCEQTGRIRNFVKAAGKMEGEFEGYCFNDSDVYKIVEGAAYALAAHPDPKLDKYLDDLIAKIAAAQWNDGYLNTYYTLTDRSKRWTNIRSHHELYCAGHLIEAAVAHHQTTGKRTLLDVASKFADHIDATFGPDKRHETSGHEEIELALVRLHHATGEDRYLKLAAYFLDQRGRADGRELFGEYHQDHKPVREQSEIVGHAVRAMYLYCGMADVAAITGDRGLLNAMDRIWQDVVFRKMYVTGGIGSSAHNEGFTSAYDLPNDAAYAETCAGIGMVFWNHRLNLLHGDAKYADEIERVLYNGLLSGLSLDCQRFFYVNPLASWGTHHRQPWYDCACCPSNVARFFPKLGEYIYAFNDEAVFVNLYVGSEAKLSIAQTAVTLTQQTRYPWDGAVKVTLKPEKDVVFSLGLRVPAWCRSPKIKANGEALSPLKIERGYAFLQRPWKSGDVIELELPMPIERVECNPLVTSNAGRVVLQRGPIVYCLGAADSGGRVRNLALPRTARLKVEHKPNLLGGVSVIRGDAVGGGEEDWSGLLYRQGDVRRTRFTAIPYFAWDNRDAGEMLVWIPESPTLTDPGPLPGVTASASHCWKSDTVRALCDRLEPRSSNDQSVPRFTWWDKRGTTEWVRYDFEKPRLVAAAEVYWFEDKPTGGGCRVPKAWRLEYLDGDEWRPVKALGEHGNALDAYSPLTFDPVETKALRIVVELQKEYSGGILEWRIIKR